MKRFFRMMSRNYREQKNAKMQGLLDECARRRANGWKVDEINLVMRLNKRMLWGEKHYFIEPVKKPRWVVGPMFGENYASTSDGTWAEMLGDQCGYPVPIHDRFETQEQYEMLSR